MEHIHFYTASFWRRAGASFLDGLVFFVPIFVVFEMLLGMDASRSSQDWRFNLAHSLYLAILPLLWSGYTLGKRAVGIRIMKADGTRMGVWTMLLREVIGRFLLGTVTFGVSAVVSALMIACRKDHRGIHDMMAGTMVVYR
ncbi:RDD family protein [Ectobacillus ponti]|uniref:RDD family protein n=1 Tax=Ectobacillus ponti TaxID=2961894 RepID=A0AA41X4A6_9BACI|nr:RDD family protein [Ectobacillus ponti]MCP8968462.1 RDD family protein [Ectobacillus ponti]